MNLSNWFGLTCSLLVVAASYGQGPDLKQVENRFGGPVMRVAKPKAAPTNDGKLDDACWNDAKPVTLGFSTGAWLDAPSQKTEARVLADEKAIYFAVRCLESEPGRIIKSGQARKGMVVGADAVEYFLDPGCQGKRHEYFHVIVTPDEKVYTGRGREPEGWRGAVTAKVGSTEGGWTVEAAIPFAELALKEGAIPVGHLGDDVPRWGCRMGVEACRAADRRGGTARRCDFVGAASGQQNVAWFEVAVDDAVLVSVVDGLGQGLHQLRRLLDRLRGAVNAVRQRAAVHVFPGKKRAAVGFAYVVDLDNIGVLQARRRLGLGAEACAYLGPGVSAGEDHFQGHEASQTHLTRHVNHAHTASARFSYYLVAGDGRRRSSDLFCGCGIPLWRRGPGTLRVGMERP